MSNANNGPKLKAAGLWAKTSAKGAQYFVGRLGGVKVLVLENYDRQGDQDPTHHLFFAEAPDRRPGGQDHTSGRGQDHQAPLPGNDTPPPPAGNDHPEQQRRSSPPGDSFDDGPPW
jgi:hypothetical protein